MCLVPNRAFQPYRLTYIESSEFGSSLRPVLSGTLFVSPPMELPSTWSVRGSPSSIHRTTCIRVAKRLVNDTTPTNDEAARVPGCLEGRSGVRYLRQGPPLASASVEPESGTLVRPGLGGRLWPRASRHTHFGSGRFRDCSWPVLLYPSTPAEWPGPRRCPRVNHLGKHTQGFRLSG